MEPYLLALAIVLSVSNCCLGSSQKIRLPPFVHEDRKGAYDVELKRTEIFNGEQYSTVEGAFHIDVTDTAIRVVTKRFTFSGISPKYQSEEIYSKRNGSVLTVNTETGKEPSRVVYLRHVDDEPTFYGEFHGVSVINGSFSNFEGSLWDLIERNAEAVVANKPILPKGIEVGLLKHGSYWLLKRVRVHLESGQGRQLYSPKFYDFKAPSAKLLSASEELNCEYGSGNREQKFRYELTCKYEKGQSAVIRVDITVHNYRPDVAVSPLSDDEVYAPTIVTVPNGFHVGIVYEGKIDHMWQDGRIVRRIDRKAISAANSASFRRSSRSRFIWVGASLILLLLVISVRLWLRRKAKASS